MKKIKIYTNENKHTSLVWAIMGVFLISTVFLTIQSTSVGSKLADLEREERELVEENQKLSKRLVSSMSLTKIRDQSEDLGYAKPESTVFLGSTEAVASLR